MRKGLMVVLSAASLGLAACQHPDGSLDMGNTLLLGAGVAAVAGVAAAASEPQHFQPAGWGYGHRPHGWGPPAHHGWHRPHGWGPPAHHGWHRPHHWNGGGWNGGGWNGGGWNHGWRQHHPGWRHHPHHDWRGW